MADKTSTAPRDITTVELRPRDLKRVRLIKVKQDYANNPDVIAAALYALERDERTGKAKVAA